MATCQLWFFRFIDIRLWGSK